MEIETKSVLEFINTHKGKTKKELALLMGIKIENFTYHYRKLLKEGKIEKIDDQTKLTPEVIKKLEEYFTYGLTDKQACFRAEIGTTQFYSYCRENPDWAERREILKDDVIVNAKITVAKKVKEQDDTYTKLVYQQHKQAERADIKVNVSTGIEKMDEEIKSTNITLEVNFED